MAECKKANTATAKAANDWQFYTIISIVRVCVYITTIKKNFSSFPYGSFDVHSNILIAAPIMAMMAMMEGVRMVFFAFFKQHFIYDSIDL